MEDGRGSAVQMKAYVRAMHPASLPLKSAAVSLSSFMVNFAEAFMIL